MNGCNLADTGMNFFVIIGVASAILLGALYVGARKAKIGLRGLCMMVAALVVVLGIVPVHSFADARCAPLMAAGASSGQKGQLQTYNVVHNNLPTPGATFVLSSLRLALRTGSPVGSTVSGDSLTVAIPVQGTFEAGTAGAISFAPEPSFVGASIGVAFTIADTAGNIGSGEYIPVVTDGAVVCLDSDLWGPVLRSRSVAFAGMDGEQASTSLLAGGAVSFSAIASSSDGTKLVAAEDSGYIYTSTDSGATWTVRTAVGARGWRALASSSNGTKLVAVEAGGYIYTSTDSGATWTEQTLSGTRNWFSVASSTDGTSLVATDYGGYIYTSTDSGATWTEQTLSGMRNWMTIASSSDGAKLVAADYSGYIYTSTDSGATWTEQTSAGMHFWLAVTSSIDGDNLTVADNIGYIYTSTDSGATWTEQTSLGVHNWNDIASSSDGTYMAAAEFNGYIYTSTDSGATWTEQTSSGAHQWNTIASSSDGTQVAAAEYDGYIYTSTDSGATWTVRHPLPAIDTATVDIDPTQPGLQRTIDMTTTEGWSAVYDSDTDTYTATLTDAVLFASSLPRTAWYTLYVDGCTQPVPASISLDNSVVN